ncbi:hypothetical protein ALC60_02404 [Trachymyrmex zeteki]|uniref:Uncharacterized protein n=1 Tax=Mycetomoellerius zeteki TaxID=64791 RepID=A0A151XEE9_9HYME|nr:hypothetical protein ALC60_02404 [Trachymyrmex zeteki]
MQRCIAPSGKKRAESSDRSYFPLRILEHCVHCVLRLLAEPREHEVMHARLRLRPPPLPLRRHYHYYRHHHRR